MDPQQYPSGSSGSQYDFIMNPAPPPKANRLGSGNSGLALKLAFAAGGALLVVALIVVGINVFFGSNNNFSDLSSLAETQTELIRISDEGKRANDQAVRNAAMTTFLTLTTQQQNSLAYLQKYHIKLNQKQLALKKNLKTDAQLQDAQQTSTYDAVFGQLMRSQLQDYMSTLQDVYNTSTGRQEKAILQTDYFQTQLLLKQWPS